MVVLPEPDCPRRDTCGWGPGRRRGCCPAFAARRNTLGFVIHGEIKIVGIGHFHALTQAASPWRLRVSVPTSRFERREAMERARQSRTSGRARSPVPVRHDRVAGVFGKRKPRGVVIYSDWAFAAPFRISEFDRARCRRHRVLRRRTIRRPEKPSQGGSLRVRNRLQPLHLIDIAAVP